MSKDMAVDSREASTIRLNALLRQHQDLIRKRWLEEILNTYPPRSRAFLTRTKDPFANPVGAILAESTAQICDALIADSDTKSVAPPLERIVSVRAVQECSASQAVGFLFLLKGCVREALEKDLDGSELYDSWRLLEAKIDEMALLAFQVFMNCREAISELRIREVKRIGFRLLKKAGLIGDDAEVPLDRQEVGGG